MFLNSFHSFLCTLFIHDSIHQVIKLLTIVSSHPTCVSHLLLEADSQHSQIHENLIGRLFQVKP